MKTYTVLLSLTDNIFRDSTPEIHSVTVYALDLNDAEKKACQQLASDLFILSPGSLQVHQVTSN